MGLLMIDAAKTPEITGNWEDGKLISVAINVSEGFSRAYNEQIKAAGGRWQSHNESWLLPVGLSAHDAVTKLQNLCKLKSEDGLLEAMKSQAEALSSLSSQLDIDIDIPAPDGLAYMGYQKVGIAYALQRGSALIADEPGLGKTIQAVGISNAVPEIKRVLVVAPATLRINWRREWQKWCVKGLSVGIVASGKPEDWPQVDVILITYDLVAKHLVKIHEKTWDMLIVDEAHTLRNSTAKRTQNIFGHKQKDKPTIPAIPANRKILLTGTPIVNRPVELWPLISAVNPDRFCSFWAFANRYCEATKSKYGWDFSGAENLDELQVELRAHCMVRRKKSDVLKELPAKTRQIIRVENAAILKKEKAALRKIRDDVVKVEASKILAYLSDNIDKYDNASKLGGSGKSSGTNVFELRHLSALAKVPLAASLVEEALEQGKVILFAHHKDVIEAYKSHFGSSAVVVNGSMSAEQRQASVDRFQNDDSCTVFIGSLQAAGVGLTLTASSHVIFAELDWVPGNMTQAEDRAHRLGQLDNVLIWHVVVDDSIDAKIADLLVRKQTIIDAVMAEEIETESESENEAVAAAVSGVSRIVSASDVRRWAAYRHKSEELPNSKRGLRAQAARLRSADIEHATSSIKLYSTVDNETLSDVDAFILKALADLDQLNQLQSAYTLSLLNNASISSIVENTKVQIEEIKITQENDIEALNPALIMHPVSSTKEIANEQIDEIKTQKDSVNLAFKVPREFRHRVRKIAADQDISLVEVLRVAIDLYEQEHIR